MATLKVPVFADVIIVDQFWQFRLGFLREKTFVNSQRIANFQKVFSLCRKK